MVSQYSRAFLFTTLVGLVACQNPEANVSTDHGSQEDALGSQLWLHTQGNQILDSNGKPWMTRGVNIFDTRGCNACAYQPADVAEVNRRVDSAVTDWHATLIRLDLESYATADGRDQWQGVLQDANYLGDIQQIVDHISTYSNVYVLMSLLVDPSFNAQNIPNEQTAQEWTLLATTFAHYPNVIFGVANEPHTNSGDSDDVVANQNQNVWTGMNESVQAIRTAENGLGTPHHLVAVQGTQAWARYVNYYVQNPIPSDNVIYETHIYDPTSAFDEELTAPHQTLPMIIGEFGEWTNTMTPTDCTNLMNLADQLGVSYAGWSFHYNCGIALLQSTGDACGIDAPIVPTDWGTLLRNHLIAMEAASPQDPNQTTPTNPNSVGNAPPVTNPNNAAPSNPNTPVTTPANPNSAAPSNPNTPVTPANPNQVADPNEPTTDPTPPTTPVAPTPPAQPPTGPTTPVAPTEPTAPASGSITSTANSQFCLDVQGGATYNGVTIDVYGCNNSAQQTWTLSGSTITAFGKCLDDSWGLQGDGSQLSLSDCNGSAEQQWQVVGGTLRLAGTSKCVDLVGGLFADWNAVELQTCNGAASQNWNLP